MKNMKKKRKKMNKNKKMKIEGDKDEETRAEIENGMKPVLELKKLLKENEKIKYEFIFYFYIVKIINNVI